MTAAEELDALRRLLNKNPRIGLRTALRAIAEREKQDAMTERLRAENAARRAAVRMREIAGFSEGLIYG